MKAPSGHGRSGRERARLWLVQTPFCLPPPCSSQGKLLPPGKAERGPARPPPIDRLQKHGIACPAALKLGGPPCPGRSLSCPRGACLPPRPPPPQGDFQLGQHSAGRGDKAQPSGRATASGAQALGGSGPPRRQRGLCVPLLAGPSGRARASWLAHSCLSGVITSAASSAACPGESARSHGLLGPQSISSASSTRRPFLPETLEGRRVHGSHR